MRRIQHPLHLRQDLTMIHSSCILHPPPSKRLAGLTPLAKSPAGPEMQVMERDYSRFAVVEVL
jgi:hypothetical protein